MITTRTARVARASLPLACLVAACLGLLSQTSAPLRAEGPSVGRGTASLLDLIPPDSGLVLTVDDLRGQYKELASSRIVDALSKTSLVRDWLNSDKYQEQQDSREQVERMLQITLEEFRDDILGDAAVLSLYLPPDVADPSRARGLLVVKPRTPAKLSRLIETINEAQRSNGEIDEVALREHAGIKFSVREFADGSGRPDEAYVSFADGVFALSNSEDLIRGVIDRKSGKSAGAKPASAGAKPALERFREVDGRLPTRALARLFIDPRMVERLLRNAPSPHSAGEAAIRGYIASHDAAGAAITAGDQRISLHTAETFDARKLEVLLGREAGGAQAATIDRIPDRTLAIAALQVDLAGAYELLRRSIPESELPKVANVEAIARGLLLGHDLRTDILPKVGPLATLVVRAPAAWVPGAEAGDASRGRLPLPASLAVELGAKEVAQAIDNAFQTGLAIISLEPKHGGGKSRLVTTRVAGGEVRSLAPPVPAAYGIDRDGRRVVLGTSVEAVGEALSAKSGGPGVDRFRRVLAAESPGAQSFMCVDIAAVHAMVAAHDDAIAGRLVNGGEPKDKVRKDLAHANEVLGLFDTASWGARFEKAPASLVQEISLVPRP
ncbi:hypothetical protein OJF2_17470 [Aquisphaera giovannonii]|uniref:Uncharacterized protein n=1 Tax=Aquisphaera giovannonii TaxID=406548 RepID=A0A5B9VZ53_9BACT|nr:hypothetical protein [Aquisphaera giovannonii]QEH33247.1 hypothetical protein OJF2_17470 [Aquisphaera giovannonii]